MRRIIICVSLLMIGLKGLQGQTVIPPGEVSGTWPLAGSPFLVQGDIQIPDTATLTIDPGVTVEFQGHYSLNVQGRLLAIGTETDSIIFTINDTTGFSNPDTGLGGWNGIRFIDTPATNDSSKIVYCRLQYGKAVGNVWPANSGGAICATQFDKLLIAHCLFIHNCAGDPINEGPAGGAIHFGSSDAQLSENTFRYNHAHRGGAIYFNGSAPVSSLNLIEYNYAYQGGGILIEGDSHPLFQQDVIRYNHADDRGGGLVFWSHSISTLNSVSITNNTSWWGAGMGVYDAEIFLTDCQVSYNRAENLGGGIHADFSTLHIHQTTFQRDTSDSGSGGIHAWYCEVDAAQCQFSENMAINGGAFHSDYSQVEIYESTFSRNTATNGAGIHAYCIDLLVDSCTFSQNIALNNGGAVDYTADTAGFTIPYHLELTRSRFELNYAITLGGAVNINQLNSDSSLVDLLIDRCIFTANSADHVASLRVIGSIHDFIVSNSIFTANSALKWVGGPYFLLNCQGEVFNCLISSNQASIGGGTYSGGGATVAQEAQVDFYNCTFAHNSSSYGAGLHVRLGSIVNVMNSIFWGNFPEQINLISQTNRITSLTLNNCDIENGIDSILVDSLSVLQWGQGNINLDPVFINPAGNDYHLQDDSPCIGAGVDSLEILGNWYIAPSSDLDGNLRPNPAGSMPDMGAYESPLATPVGISKDLGSLPEQFYLYQNYPNPFNASTVISWLIPSPAQGSDVQLARLAGAAGQAVGSPVNLAIYDLSGREVTVLVNEKQKAGYHQVEFNAAKLSSGMYFYRLKAGEFVQIKKALLLK